MSAAARGVAQLWVELRADDPEAASALEVARRGLEDARTLVSVRRLRVYELTGSLPAVAPIEKTLHGSIQFYNPAKERPTLRVRDGDPAPVAADEWLILVRERGGERRPSAERWWRHETGGRITVREAVAWALRFDPADPEGRFAAGLAVARDRRHGLLDRKSTRLNSSHNGQSRMPSSA